MGSRDHRGKEELKVACGCCVLYVELPHISVNKHKNSQADSASLCQARLGMQLVTSIPTSSTSKADPRKAFPVLHMKGVGDDLLACHHHLSIRPEHEAPALHRLHHLHGGGHLLRGGAWAHGDTEEDVMSPTHSSLVPSSYWLEILKV